MACATEYFWQAVGVGLNLLLVFGGIPICWVIAVKLYQRSAHAD